MPKDTSRLSGARLPAGCGSPFFGDTGIKSQSITITLVANAGVLIEHNGTGLLVDGIHHEPGHLFSRVAEQDLHLMRQGTGIFKNLTYLLFTHEHPDHFSPRYVLQLIHSRQIQGLFLPHTANGSHELSLLVQEARNRAIPLWELGLSPGKTQQITLSYNLRVTVIGTRHMGPGYQTLRNDCFLITLAGKNILLTGDADHVREYFKKPLANVDLDVLFINPIFYHNLQGQKIIHEIFCPRHLVIYHMPFAQDDTERFSSMVQRDVARLARPGMYTHIFSAEKQSFSLPVCIP